MSLDVRFVEQARRDLTALLAAHPELEEDEVLRLDMIEGETSALELIDKLIEAEREAYRQENSLKLYIFKMEQRKQRFEDRRAYLRKYMMQLMEAAGLKKVERPAATVSIAAGRPKVVITDENELPDYFVRIKKEPNKDAIAKAFKEGRKNIPGAALSNAEPVLRIS